MVTLLLSERAPAEEEPVVEGVEVVVAVPPVLLEPASPTDPPDTRNDDSPLR